MTTFGVSRAAIIGGDHSVSAPAYLTPEYVGGSGPLHVGFDTDPSVDAPATVLENDVLVATIIQGNDAGTITFEAGWTQLWNVDGDGVRGAAWYKIITDPTSEPSSYEFTCSVTGRKWVSLSQLRYIDLTTPVDDSDSGTTLALSLTTTMDDTFIFASIGSLSDGSYTHPSSLSSRLDGHTEIGAVDVGGAVATGIEEDTGDTGDYAWVGGTANRVTGLVAFRPMPAPTRPTPLAQGVVEVTGFLATIVGAAEVVLAGAASIAVTGYAATMVIGTVLSAGAGVVAVSGYNANAKLGDVIIGGDGVLAVTGHAGNVRASDSVIWAGAGVVEVTGHGAATAQVVIGGTGVAEVTGQAATLYVEYDETVVGGAGVVAVTGQAAEAFTKGGAWVRDSEYYNSGNIAVSTIVVDVPSYEAGDLLVAVIGTEYDRAITAPAGWTLFDSYGMTSPHAKMSIYYRWVASEPSDYTWTNTGTASPAKGIIMSVAGALSYMTPLFDDADAGFGALIGSTSFFSGSCTQNGEDSTSIAVFMHLHSSFTDGTIMLDSDLDTVLQQAGIAAGYERHMESSGFPYTRSYTSTTTANKEGLGCQILLNADDTMPQVLSAGAGVVAVTGYPAGLQTDDAVVVGGCGAISCTGREADPLMTTNGSSTVTFVAAATEADHNDNTPNFYLGGLQAGDLVVAICAATHNFSPYAPSGWTSGYGAYKDYSGYRCGARMAYKIATGTSISGSFTVSSSSARGALVIAAFRGVDQTTPVSENTGANSGTAYATIASGNACLTWNTNAATSLGSDGQLISPPSGYTEYGDIASGEDGDYGIACELAGKLTGVSGVTGYAGSYTTCNVHGIIELNAASVTGLRVIGQTGQTAVTGYAATVVTV